jgi:AcrR family transcriptional regulator
MTTTRGRPGPRRGRPPAGSSAVHREVILDAVFELLAERGYQGTTMAAVAARAGSSKETLYAWFGSKQGLFTALIRRQAEAANQAVATALDGDGGDDPAATLTAFATNLLLLLLGERSVALNRARWPGPTGSWPRSCSPRGATAPGRSSRPTWPAWPPRATSASTTRPTPSACCTGW